MACAAASSAWSNCCTLGKRSLTVAPAVDGDAAGAYALYVVPSHCSAGAGGAAAAAVVVAA